MTLLKKLKTAAAMPTGPASVAVVWTRRAPHRLFRVHAVGESVVSAEPLHPSVEISSALLPRALRKVLMLPGRVLTLDRPRGLEPLPAGLELVGVGWTAPEHGKRRVLRVRIEGGRLSSEPYGPEALSPVLAADEVKACAAWVVNPELMRQKTDSHRRAMAWAGGGGAALSQK